MIIHIHYSGYLLYNDNSPPFKGPCNRFNTGSWWVVLDLTTEEGSFNVSADDC